MIELKLIPDGASEVPAEARDHGILATHLENNGSPSSDTANATGTANTWKDIERIVPGHREYIAIRVPGEVADYSGNSLDGFKNAIVNNISGLKAHPDGWTHVTPSAP